MPLSAIFDTMIGLVLIYLVLSMVSMSINEAISGLVRLRGKVLFAEIGRILDDPEVRDRFWSSGLICSLSRTAKTERMANSEAPSFICATTFATALVDALRKIDTAANADDKSAAERPITQPQADGTAIATEAGADRQNEQGLAALVDKIREDSILRDVLTGFASQVGRSEEQFKGAIAAWFDQVMDRATGVYKRYMQLISLLVALFIAFAVNADTLSMADAIWQDEALQTQLVDLSRKQVEQGLPAAQEQTLTRSISTLTRDLHPLPLGWASGGENVFWKIVGLLLTAFAMTLGAPFWFDLLSRFVKIRSAGVVASGDSQN